MNRVVHFEIQAADPARAAKFYQGVFGWSIKEFIVPDAEIKDENRYWLVSTGPDSERGINGGILFRRGPAPVRGQPVSAYVCTIGVASLDKSVEKALKAGAQVAAPKMPIKGMGWLTYLEDTEGNIFGMMQEDKNAA